jgi:hypothetical protein
MSINDFFNKIKHKIGIDTMTLVCLCIIVLVALGSFGLGRLSVSSMSKPNASNIKEAVDTDLTKEVTGNSSEIKNNLATGDTSLKEKLYVASKNGKLYYSKDCSGAKRIMEKNQVWFATSIEAEKSGYSKASSCK